MDEKFRYETESFPQAGEKPVDNSELVTENRNLKKIKVIHSDLWKSRDLSTVKRRSYPHFDRVIPRVIHRTGVRANTRSIPTSKCGTFRRSPTCVRGVVPSFLGFLWFVLSGQGLVLSMFWMAVGVMAGWVFCVLFCRVW